jgi:translocator protein
MATQNSRLLEWSNILAFILMVVVNSLAGSTTIIGGQNTAEISDVNPTLITPAGYVFAIWGAIYFLLGIFVIYQALPRQRGKAYKEKIGWLFVISSLLNIAWIFLWQYEYLIYSAIVIFSLLVSLILIYIRLDIGKTKVDLREKLAIHVPFSTYLGWITIASIANVAVVLVSINWNGWGISPETWAILIVIVAILITMLVLATRRDIAYSLVIIWALVGISVGNNATQNITTLTQVGALIVFVALVVAIVVTKLRQK